MLTLLAIVGVLLLGQNEAAVDFGCADCICANSGGRSGGPDACVMPEEGSQYCLEGTYCGPYGMSIQYWVDVGSRGGNFFDCMHDWDCANKTLNTYINKYCTVSFVGHAAPCSCEEAARIHHCGPWSIYAASCDAYWPSVQYCLSF